MIIDMKDVAHDALVIREWCYLSERAFRDGLAILAQLDSQFAKVRWLCGEIDSYLRLGISNPVPTIELRPGMMSRVLHLPAFEELLSMKLSDIKIVDPLGISDGGDGGGSGCTIGPGHLVQIVTGFAEPPPSSGLDHLYKIAGQKRAFSVEKF